MPKVTCVKCGTESTQTDEVAGTYQYTCDVCGQTVEVVVGVDEAVVLPSCPMCGKANIPLNFFERVVFYTNKGPADGSLVITIVGPSDASWEIHDGDTIVTQIGVSTDYTFVTNGSHQVILTATFSSITHIFAQTQKITSITGLSLCTALTELKLATNTELILNLSVLPVGFTRLNAPTVSGLSGGIDKFELTYAYFSSANVTGSLDDLSADCTYIVLNNSRIDGTNVGRFTKAASIQMKTMAMDQTRVNAIIDSAYEAKDNFIAPVIFYIQQNVAPSAPQIAKLIELRDTKGWTIGYDA